MTETATTEPGATTWRWRRRVALVLPTVAAALAAATLLGSVGTWAMPMAWLLIAIAALVLPSRGSGPMRARDTAVVLVLAVVAAYLVVNLGVMLVRDGLS